MKSKTPCLEDPSITDVKKARFTLKNYIEKSNCGLDTFF
jgi:hypothetical protein